MSSNSKEWFATWFNSPYYHQLYQHRDEAEAHQFITALLGFLSFQKGDRVLDLACGKGRYSTFLAEQGLDVIGIDIAQDSIAFANKMANEHLQFYVHDIRLPYHVHYFDYIFNFFTSFGYFETENDHLKTIRHIANGLKTEGKFVIDFFNTHKVKSQMQPYTEKTVGDLTFRISKRMDERGYILKNIQFEDKGQAFNFTEKVRGFTLEDFEVLFAKAGMKIAHIFGDYQLAPFDKEQSDRLILVGCKSGC